MKRIIISIAIFSAMIAASLAHAEITPGAFTLSPFIGGYTFDAEQHLRTRPVYGMRAGYDFTKNWGVEALFDYVRTKSSRVDDSADAYRYGADVLYHFMPDSKIVPYLAAGFGGTTVNYQGGIKNENNALFNYGGGLKYFLTDSIALRADARHIWVFDNADTNFEYSLGLTFAFGGKKAVAMKPAEPAPEPVKVAEPPKPEPATVKIVGDSDGDGVNDNLDKCPDTPKGVKVDKDGCPVDSDGDGVPDYLDKCPDTPKGVAVNKDGCPLDSDGDGVPDYLDKCPDTPKGVTVDKDGCPVDSDGDGVPDYLDKCPNTPKGEKVDANGCSEKLCISLDVLFDLNKAVIKPTYHDEIKKVADYMIKFPETTAVIEGHTCNIGTAAYNQKLSERRAEAVVTYLVKKFGIAKKRLSAKGYGESKPIADNATEEGRAKNRRINAIVDCVILKK